MAYQGVRECAVCAWREGCRLKWRNEPNGALFCPEFTFDLRLARERTEADTPPERSAEMGADD